MKKLLMLAAAGLLAGSTALAECKAEDFIPDIFDRSSGIGGLLMYTSTFWPIASSTSGSGNTSGTPGCDDTALYRFRQRRFVAAVIDNLSQEIAQGGGEHLQSLSTLLGYPRSDYAELVVLARQNYENLFPSSASRPEAFLSRLKGRLRDHPQFRQSCVYI